MFVVETKGEFNLFRFIIINWKQVLLGSILASITAFGIYWKGKLMYLNHQLSQLREDQKTVVGLMREIQKETFDNKTMSMNDYKTAMEQYEEQLAGAVKSSIEIESAKVAHKSIFKRKNKAEIERERLMQLMKDTQKAYLDENKIETRAYKHRMNTLRNRLSEVDEKLAVQEAGKAIKERGWIRSKLKRKKQPEMSRTRKEVQKEIEDKKSKKKQKKKAKKQQKSERKKDSWLAKFKKKRARR
ncbi:MAG: hypothetical protein R6U26_03135, partial [Candidatus Undinarchaeales archaeon]